MRSVSVADPAQRFDTSRFSGSPSFYARMYSRPKVAPPSTLSDDAVLAEAYYSLHHGDVAAAVVATAPAVTKTLVERDMISLPMWVPSSPTRSEHWVDVMPLREAVRAANAEFDSSSDAYREYASSLGPLRQLRHDREQSGDTSGAFLPALSPQGRPSVITATAGEPVNIHSLPQLPKDQSSNVNAKRTSSAQLRLLDSYYQQMASLVAVEIPRSQPSAYAAPEESSGPLVLTRQGDNDWAYVPPRPARVSRQYSFDPERPPPQALARETAMRVQGRDIHAAMIIQRTIRARLALKRARGERERRAKEPHLCVQGCCYSAKDAALIIQTNVRRFLARSRLAWLRKEVLHSEELADKLGLSTSRNDPLELQPVVHVQQHLPWMLLRLMASDSEINLQDKHIADAVAADAADTHFAAVDPQIVGLAKQLRGIFAALRDFDDSGVQGLQALESLSVITSRVHAEIVNFRSVCAELNDVVNALGISGAPRPPLGGREGAPVPQALCPSLDSLLQDYVQSHPDAAAHYPLLLEVRANAPDNTAALPTLASFAASYGAEVPIVQGMVTSATRKSDSFPNLSFILQMAVQAGVPVPNLAAICS